MSTVQIIQDGAGDWNVWITLLPDHDPLTFGFVNGDPDSAEHKAYAMSANSQYTPDQLDQPTPDHLVFACEIAGLLGVDAGVIETWSTADRRAVLAWLDAGVDRSQVPPCIGLPHIAAGISAEANGSGEQRVQSCAECGARLVTIGAHQKPYPVGAMVGQHCTGLESGAQAAAAPAMAEAHA